MLYDTKVVIQAGAEIALAKRGNFVRYREAVAASGTLALRVRTSTGSDVDMAVGESFNLGEPFNWLNIRNDGPAAIVATFLIGFGSSDGAASVIVSNALTIADMAVKRSLEGRAFAGQYSNSTQWVALQLWNGGGTPLVLRHLAAGLAISGAVAYFVEDAQRTDTGGASLRPKLLGSSSVAGITWRTSNPGAAIVAGPGIVSVVPPDSSLNYWPVQTSNNEFFVLPEGKGLTAQWIASTAITFRTEGWVE